MFTNQQCTELLFKFTNPKSQSHKLNLDITDADKFWNLVQISLQYGAHIFSKCSLCDLA
jgi:hypothetical protein